MLDAVAHGVIRPPQGIFIQSPQQKADIGYKLPFNDGRVFAYCKDGGSGLTMGQLAQSPAVDTTNDIGLAVAVAGVSTDKQLSVTIPTGHASFVANQYTGGWLLVADGTEIGLARMIKSHPAFTTGTAAAVIFKFRDELGEAVAVSGHTCKLLANPYNLVIVNATVTGLGSNTGRVLGVPVIDITASYFFWMLVRGIGPGLNNDDAAIAVGTALIAAGTDVEIMTAFGDMPIGWAATYCADDSKSLLVDYRLG